MNAKQMRTHNGYTFTVSADDMSRNVIDLDDIATSLAKQCRFNGHVPGFYSVAEHSILVSWLVPQNMALLALVHDIAEAYVGDIVSPIKDNCPWVKDFERTVYRHILASLGIDHLFYATGAEQRRVKEADLTALAIEFNYFHGWVPHHLTGLRTTPLGAHQTPKGLDWQDARLAFINRFNDLTAALSE